MISSNDGKVFKYQNQLRFQKLKTGLLITFFVINLISRNQKNKSIGAQTTAK